MKEMPSIICGEQAYQFLEYPVEKRGKRTWSGKARNASDGRLYFIKYARQGDENALFLLRREAKFRISHRSIMKVYGGYQGTLRMGMRGEEVSFVLSEWIDGYSLPEYLERPQIKRLRKEAPEEFNEKMLGQIRQLMSAMEAYMGTGGREPFVHRDLKPMNLLVRREDESLVLCDFDWSHCADNGTGQRPEYISGTAGYMDPAAAYSRETDIQLDIYSLGQVMLYWLIGQDYYSHDEKIDYLHKETLAHDLDIRRIPQQYRTEKYKPLLVIIRRLIARRGERYESMGQIIQDYDAFIKRCFQTGSKEAGAPLSLLKPRELSLASVAYESPYGGYAIQNLCEGQLIDIRWGRQVILSLYMSGGKIDFITYPDIAQEAAGCLKEKELIRLFIKKEKKFIALMQLD